MHNTDRSKAARAAWKRALNGHMPHAETLDRGYENLPLHMKDVPRIDWAAIDECVSSAPMDNETKLAYYHSRNMITSPELLSTIPKTYPYKPHISESDFDLLFSKNMVERCTTAPKGYVGISTTAEKLDLTTLAPTRRRVLVVPWDHNNFIQEAAHVELCSVEDILSALHHEGAQTADISACYTHYPLPAEARAFYCFFYHHSDEKKSGWYQVTTIPTGGRHCPSLAHSVLAAITAHTQHEISVSGAQKDETTGVLNAYIDNIRICGNRKFVEAAMRIIQRRMRELNFVLNVETQFTDNYIFLGVQCQHATPTHDPCSQAGSKTIAKLRRIRSDIFEPQATYLDGLQLLGLLMWIARIAAIPLAQFYGPLKFFRRRASTSTTLEQPLRVWPCVKKDLTTWIDTSLANPMRIIKTESQEDTYVTAYSDASDEGFGGLIFQPRHCRLHLLAGHWSDEQRQMHINRKEAWALTMVVDKILALQTDGMMLGHIKIYVDNTTVCNIVDKERSRCFWANQWTLGIQQKLRLMNASVTWLPSISNLADAPSRLIWNGLVPRGTINWQTSLGDDTSQ